jgi:hypothetical protein
MVESGSIILSFYGQSARDVAIFEQEDTIMSHETASVA